MNYSNLKLTICDVAHQLWNEGLIDFPDGNLSVIVQHPKIEGEKVFLATISSCDKKYLEPKSVILYNRDRQEIGEKGIIFKDGTKPTKDLPIHVAIYEATKASAVLHSHGFYTMLYGALFSGKRLDHPLGEAVMGKNYWSVYQARLGVVAVTEPACSGKDENSEIVKHVKEAAAKSRAIIVPTSGSYIYSELEDPELAIWNCLYAARSLERWVPFFVSNPDASLMDGTETLKKTFEQYKNTPPGVLPLFDQMKARG